eukprot:6456229-Amphidinium_carterae.1
MRSAQQPALSAGMQASRGKGSDSSAPHKKCRNVHTHKVYNRTTPLRGARDRTKLNARVLPMKSRTFAFRGASQVQVLVDSALFQCGGPVAFSCNRLLNLNRHNEQRVLHHGTWLWEACRLSSCSLCGFNWATSLGFVTTGPLLHASHDFQLTGHDSDDSGCRQLTLMRQSRFGQEWH